MRKIWKQIVSAIVLCSFVFFFPIYGKENVDLNAKYEYVADAIENREYYSKQGTETIYPASMTKIVTCIVAIDAIDDLEKTITIEDSDLEGLQEANATVAGFTSGESLTYKDLLYGSLLPSGADASNALARLTYGSVDDFVDAMNTLCKKLKLKNTHFINPTGLHDDKHYTTPKEMAELLRYAYKNETFQAVYGAKEYTSSNQLHTWQNTLYALSVSENMAYDDIVGAKTGYTLEAQSCVASIISSKGHDVISILAYEEERKNLLVDLESIKTYLNNTYEMVSLDSIIDKHRFRNHLQKTDIYRQNETELYLLKDYNLDDLVYTYEYTIKKAPIKKNTTVGTYTISYNGEPVVSGNLIRKEDVDRSILLIVFKTILILCVLVGVGMCALRYRNIKKRKKKRRKR